MGASDTLGSRNQSPHACLVLGAPKKGARQSHLPKSQRGTRMCRETALTNPWLCPAALEGCSKLGITPRLGSHGPNSQQEAFFHDFL